MRFSTQEWISASNILDNGIIECKEKYVKIVKVFPINYELKSSLEKQAILNSYKLFLKSCEFNIQILIKSRKENIKKHIKKLQEEAKKEENKILSKLYENYIKYIETLNEKKKSSSKNFYICIFIKKEENLKVEEIKIILKDNFLKVKEHLSRCGNSVQELNKEETEMLLYNLYNPNKKESI